MFCLKKLAAIFITTFCFSALANQSGTNMEERKTLVISYDYPQARVLNESTTKLHKNSSYNFHGDAKFTANILGEKSPIVIPDLSESFLNYDLDNKFSSVTFYFEPRTYWSSLDDSIERIKKYRLLLNPINRVAIKSSEFDLNKLHIDYFKNKKSEIINKYELEHYKIFFILKKLDTPQEIHPRDKEYFQLLVRVDNKNI